ncbi:MAG: hypothetical protein CMK56_03950 [Proteobacteria bacterium]|nr:hypothetical protein [Pseudomonadota bacterium]
MLNRDDWIELELEKQKNRLKFINCLLKKNTFADFPPRRIYFEPTNHCNLKCDHCAAHNGSGTRDLGFLDISLFKKVMNEISHLNRQTEINFYQHGESTLHEKLVDMIKIASIDYDFFTKLNTNGVTLTREYSRNLIDSNIDSLVFTIDSITPESYKAIKGRDLFHKVITNLLDYLEEWGDHPRKINNFFAVDIFLVEEERNKDDIRIIKELFEKLPIGHVQTYELFNYMGAVQEANGKYDERFKIPKKNWPTCNVPWDVLGIRWNGDVVSCIYDYDSRYVIGNIKDNSILDIWNSDRMQGFRQAQLIHNFSCVESKGKLCSNCTIMWQKDYQSPTSFNEEVKRMKRYLNSAIDRVSERYLRTDELLKKHSYLKENRIVWYKNLLKTIEPIRQKFNQKGIKSIKDSAKISEVISS